MKKIHFIDKGKGFPLVLIHGFPLSHKMWEPQISFFENHCRVIAYDVRGHGRSEMGDYQYTIENHADDLLSLLDELNISKACVLGLSMGGYIALRAYEKSPKKFKALILSDTKSEADSDEAKIKRFQAMSEVKIKGSAKYAKLALPGLFSKSAFEKRLPVIRKMEDIVAATPPKSIAATLLAMAARTDTTIGLAQIKVPTLVIVGKQDAITPVAVMKKMHQGIDGARLSVIPEAGHLSNLENPEQFNKIVFDFLQDNKLINHA